MCSHGMRLCMCICARCTFPQLFGAIPICATWRLAVFLVAMVASPATPAKHSSATPDKKQFYDTIRVPIPEKVGNETVDSDTQARHKLLLELVEGLIADRTMVLPLYNKYVELNKSRSKIEQHDTGSFDRISTVGKTAPEFAMSHLARVSDLSVADLLAIKKVDEDGPMQLLVYDTQLNDKLRLAKQCAVRDFWGWYLLKRSSMCGSRLASFKRDGGVTPAFGLNWTQGAYILEFDETKFLVKVTHRRSGHFVAVDKTKMMINQSWLLTANWSDWDAALQCKPMPAIRLHTLWVGKRLGPYELENYGCKTAEFAKAIAAAFDEWEEERRNSGAGRSADMMTAKAGLESMTHAKKVESLKRARGNATRTLEQKKARQAIKLDAR